MHGHERSVHACVGRTHTHAHVRQALESGHIGGLGLDVHWVEPWDPNDYVSTHPKRVRV